MIIDVRIHFDGGGGGFPHQENKMKAILLMSRFSRLFKIFEMPLLLNFQEHSKIPKNGDSQMCLGYSKLPKVFLRHCRRNEASIWKSEPKRRFVKTKQLEVRFGNGVMMITSNEEAERVHHVVR